MGKIIRRVIAVLLAATAVTLAVLPAGNAEATSVHGDYEYDGATVAKYLGTDTEVTLPAWVNRVGKEAFEGYDKMTKLVLPDSVTTVDFGAFSNCDNLATVNMSESVRTVGSAAFSGCTDLYSVSLPRTVREIGSGVFAGCTSLASVPIAATNENYTSYDGVIYSSDGKKLVQYLAGRPSTTYQMPRSVREIEEYAFWGANNLSKLSISYGVDKIPEYAFSNCKGLQHVTLPRSVQSIFAYAFENCDSLSYINIPDSIGYIDDRAFYNTRGTILRLVDDKGNVVKTFNSEDVDEYGNGTGGSTVVKLPEYVDDTKDSASQQKSDNTNNSANPANQQTSGNTTNTTNAGTTDNSGSSQNNGSTTYGTNQDQNASGSTDTNNAGNTGNTGNTANNGSNTNSSTSVQNSNGSTTFYDDGSTSSGSDFNPQDVTPLDEGDTPDTSNGANAGNGANGGNGSGQQGQQTTAPQNIIDSNNVYNNGYYKASDSGSEPWDTQIEYKDYEQNMTEADIGIGKIVGGSVVLRMSSNIPVKGFNMSNAEYEDSYSETAGSPIRKSDSDVLGNVYASYSGDAADVKVPSGVKRIGDRAFYKNENVKNVDLPNSVTDIGEFAFARSGVENVDIPNGVTNIDYAAFYKCPNLSNVNIPATVSSIALGAFEGTPFLQNFRYADDGNDYLVVGDGVLLDYKGNDKKVVIPEGVKHIGPAAFARKQNLESVAVPGTVEDIGEEAFCDCSNLKELVLSEGVRNIGDRAFKNSSLTAVSIPDSVEGIGLSSFDNGGKLKTVVFNGKESPNVTYDKSATRLSAKDLRTGAFEGAKNAIVASDYDLDSGTMFNPRFYGFSGEVYSINPTDPQMLVLERCTQKPDSMGNVAIDQMVDVAGDTYTVNSVKSDAFDSYRNWNDYYDNKPKSITV
ncbi:MAG: leucine-rich repeat protein, partial [Lachnospiraceae bacterium]|nr:leucine-rich repeat protein [Lachnospiraceae bacterium]